MNWCEGTPDCLIGGCDTMDSNNVMAIARAQQDWREGLSYDENPFPVASEDYRAYQEEFDRLNIREEIQASTSV